MIPKTDTFQACELFRPNLSFIYYQILLYVFQCPQFAHSDMQVLLT